MINPFCNDRPIFSLAVEPPGGCHGTRHQVDRQGAGRTGRHSLDDTIATIARHLRCGEETVKRIRKLYRMGGAPALYPIKPPGRRSKATPAFLQAMKKAVAANPLTLGHGFSTWSSGRLAAHLAKAAGIRFSDDRIRVSLRQEGFSFHRPKHALKGKTRRSGLRKGRKTARSLKKKP